MSVTSFASANPPLGSGAFQSSPKAVRSIVVSSSMPIFSVPAMSVCGPEIVPAAVTGRVVPLIVRLPSSARRSPSRAMEVDSKRISGWAAPSKKSGL